LKTTVFSVVFACLLSLGCANSPRLTTTDAPHDLVRHAIASLYGDVRTETLANGLRVYLKPIAGAPVVTVMTAYQVGAADEDLEHTGLAHYLEHLMFKGTDTLVPGDIDRLTQRAGGSNNAYTDADYTVYHFDFAEGKWDTALAIEADRMRNLRIDEKHEFEHEKGAVIEELRMNEDQPWDLEMKALLPALFGNGPYGHPVIGEAAHVRAATAEVIKGFYDRWYHPNNAAIIMVGGFDADEAMTMIRRRFGAIPRGELPKRREAVAVQRDGPTMVTVASKFAQPRLSVAFNGVKLGERDDFVLDVLSQVITGGKTGRLYRSLVEDLEIASAVHSGNLAGRYPGWFSIDVELLPEQNLAVAQGVVMAELARLAKEPVTSAELARARRQMAAGRIFYHEDVHNLADAIAMGAASGQPDYAKNYMANTVKVTAADVQRVAQTILDPRKSVVMWSVPGNGKAAMRSGDWLNSPPSQGGAGGGLDQLEVMRAREWGNPTSEGFLSESSNLRVAARSPRSGRSTLPQPLPKREGSQGAFDLATAQRHVLANGLTLLLLENHRLPIVVAAADVAHTHLIEPAEQGGVAELTGRLLSEGAAGLTGEAIAQQIEDVGGALSTHASGGQVKVLSSDRELGLRLLLDCLTRPTFENDAFEREKTRLLADIDDNTYEADALAADVFRSLAYGPHPFARPAIGTDPTAKKLTREQCVAFHSRAFTPNNTVLTIVGDFDSKAVLAEVSRLTAGWKKSDTTVTPPPDPPLPAAIVDRYLSMPDSAQLQVLIGHAGIRRSNADYYKLLVLDHVLGTGAGFTDRLSASLRDRQGLAYSVRGAIAGSAGAEPGLFLCSIGTNAANLKHVRSEIIKEINRLRDEPPTAEEVESAKAYLLGTFPFNLATTEGVGILLLEIERHKLGTNYVEDYRRAISAVSPKDVQDAAIKYLHPDKLIVVAVGAINANGEPIGK